MLCAYKNEWNFGDLSWERAYHINDRKAIMWSCFWRKHRKRPFNKKVFIEI